METLNQLQNLLQSDLSIAIIILVIAIAEIAKRTFKPKMNTFFFVLLVTLPLSLLYWWMKGIPIDVWYLSYISAFWLYPLIIKPGMKFFNLHYKSPIGDNPNPDHEEH